jgi:hypothetical protein
MELRLMQAHEERMSRPVREIFPAQEAQTFNVKCRGCGTQFTYTKPGGGKMRFFCTGDCKNAFYKKRSATPLCP